MRLQVNGVEEECACATLAELVAAKGLAAGSLVLELNGMIIRQEHWQVTALHDGDQVELLNFVGGG